VNFCFQEEKIEVLSPIPLKWELKYNLQKTKSLEDIKNKKEILEQKRATNKI
jgi:hypothetical protein